MVVRLRRADKRMRLQHACRSGNVQSPKRTFTLVIRYCLACMGHRVKFTCITLSTQSAIKRVGRGHSARVYSILFSHQRIVTVNGTTTIAIPRYPSFRGSRDYSPLGQRDQPGLTSPLLGLQAEQSQ